MKASSTKPTEDGGSSSVGLNKKIKQLYCSICNAALTTHSTCPVCKKTTQRLCSKCGAITAPQFHKECYQKLEWVIFQTEETKKMKKSKRTSKRKNILWWVQEKKGILYVPFVNRVAL